jgi:oxygen-independent coproporphyrinogen-3 oxidase
MPEVQDTLVVDPDLLRKFDRPGPRYTSYPTADRLVEAFGPDQYRVSLEKRVIGGFRRPLSLYVHLPFCDTICYYCGCNKIITKDHGRSAKYLRYLRKEVELVSELLGQGERVTQLHWGGVATSQPGGTCRADADHPQPFQPWRRTANTP